MSRANAYLEASDCPQDGPALLGGPPAVDIPPPHFRWPLIGEDEERAVIEQLRSGELSYQRCTGVVKEFEDEFARFHEVPYAISTSSGTSAIHAAFFGLDLEPGAEILAPAYTHLATVLPALHCHLVPVLCDVDAESGNIDVADAQARISDRTRAIVVTHQYGRICDMAAVRNLARKFRLRLVEDCSHAHGATLDGQLAGTFGDVACFSLQAHKAIPAGEGGILITRDPRIYERAALLGHFRERTAATSERYEPFVETGYGLKNRIHPLAAALALVQLRKLPERIEQRRANLVQFDRSLATVTGVRVPASAENTTRGGFFRQIVHYDAEALHGLPIARYVEALRAEGVLEVLPGNLAKPLHLTRIFQSLDNHMFRSTSPRRGMHVSHASVYGPGDFPRAERFAQSTLQFPAFTEPSAHIVDAYCRAMRKVALHSIALRDRS